MMNKSVGEFHMQIFNPSKPSGFLNQKMITITLNDGKELCLSFEYAGYRVCLGAEKFIDSLVEFHKAVKG